MTKPSYEERAARWKKAARNYRSDMLTALCNWRINRERAETAESELARVRGLLQRLHLYMGCTSWSDLPPQQRNKWITLEAETLAELNKSGAESADIGKLDTADEKLKNLLRRCYQWIPLELSDLADDVKEALGMETYRGLAGSAKSGVEMGKVNRVDGGEK